MGAIRLVGQSMTPLSTPEAHTPVIEATNWDPLWSEMLKTAVNNVAYDYRACRGTVHMPAGCCTDMQGCIDLFTGFAPDVIEINTFAGGKADTSYRRTGNTWSAK
jgi:hypothetical protein